jgi:hypothetical protein
MIADINPAILTVIGHSRTPRLGCANHQWEQQRQSMLRKRATGQWLAMVGKRGLHYYMEVNKLLESETEVKMIELKNYGV